MAHISETVKSGGFAVQEFPMYRDRMPAQLLSYLRLSRLTDTALLAKVSLPSSAALPALCACWGLAHTQLPLHIWHECSQPCSGVYGKSVRLTEWLTLRIFMFCAPFYR